MAEISEQVCFPPGPQDIHTVNLGNLFPSGLVSKKDAEGKMFVKIHAKKSQEVECLQEAANWARRPSSFPVSQQNAVTLLAGRHHQEGLPVSLSLCRPQPEHNPSLMLLLGLKEKQQFSLYRNLSLEKMYELCVVSS